MQEGLARQLHILISNFKKICIYEKKLSCRGNQMEVNFAGWISSVHLVKTKKAVCKYVERAKI